MNKRRWLALAALLLTGLVALAMSGCTPVTVRPEFDAKGLPKAIPVTPIGSQDLETGRFVPAFPTSNESPTPPKDWWPLVEQALTLALGLLVGGGAAVPLIRKTKTALRIACQLADANAAAETDLDVERNKMVAAQQQAALGVHALTQKARGKA